MINPDAIRDPTHEQILECLREAVADELERKRRLGHYYVFWEKGKLVYIGDDAPKDENPDAERRPFPAAIAV